MSMPLQEVLEGKYEILEKIGEGGIGAVYKVRHRLLEEERVIKVLRPEAAAKAELRERFLHEARMAIRMKHPNIAQLHDFSIASDDRAYIVMEFIDGVALDTLLAASGPPSVALGLEIARQGLDALEYLHANDFVHRDVSPDNLMLAAAFDGSPLVKLIDLGIARHLGAEARLTATGVFLGKARYSSPEQFQGSGDEENPVDQRSDVYSFGVLLYELLTGVYPLPGETFAELAGSHLFKPPREFAETDPEGRLPDGLRAALLKALEKSPDSRYASAAEFAAALAPFSDPDATVREEFAHTVEVATTSVPRSGERVRPGSTQDRLNAEFGLGKSSVGGGTVAPPRETVVASAGPTPAESARQIELLVSRGRRRKAARALERAIAIHGETAQLGELRAVVAVMPAARRPRWALPAALAALLVLAAGAGLWWWRGQRPAPATPIAAADPLAVPAAPGWDPGAVDRPPLAAELGELEPPAAEPPAAEPQPPPAPTAATAEEPPATAEEPPPPAEPQTAAQQPQPEPVRTTEILQPGVGVVPPVLLSLPEPPLPDDARRLREELTVVVRVLVDENGGVTTAAIESGPSFRRHYRDAALAAARQATFRPARRGSTVGRMWTEVRVTFEPD